MIEARMIEKVEHAACCAGFGVGGCKNQSRQTCQDHRPGAHRTWFQRAIQRYAVQPPMVDRSRRFTQGDHFCMGAWVVVYFPPVMTPSDNFAFKDCYCSHWHIFMGYSEISFFKGKAH